MRTIFALLLSLVVLVGCSTDEETTPVEEFDSQSVQRQLVGRWIYFAKAYAPTPNDLTYVTGDWDFANSSNYENIDTLEFKNDMTYVQTFFFNVKYKGRYDFTETFLSLYHDPTVYVFKYSFDNPNTLRLGTGKDFATFKIYRRE